MSARGTGAAKRYAKALFALASDANSIESTGAELAELLDAIEENSALHDVLVRPVHPAAERRGVLDQLSERLGLSPTLRRFCAFVIDQRRAGDLEAVREEYVRLAEQAAGRVRGELVSAAPISDVHLERLRAALGRRTGLQVELEVKVDPTLIGGAVARVGGLVFDGSLRTQLQQLRTNLTGGR